MTEEKTRMAFDSGEDRPDRRGRIRAVRHGTHAASAGRLGLPGAHPADAAALFTERPIAEFLNAQGATADTDPPVSDYVSWLPALSGPPVRWAVVDYAGLAARYLRTQGISLDTTTAGSVTELPLPDGRAEVTVILHTRNALVWMIPFDPEGPDASTQFGANPLLFGSRATDVAADRVNNEPALGVSILQLAFRNTAPGAPLPDLIQLLFREEGIPEGFELIGAAFRAGATGPLRPAFGVPDGTPGRALVTQPGILFRGLEDLHRQGARTRTFPAKGVELCTVRSAGRSGAPAPGRSASR